ncbi:MAG: sugar ABC transporter substrate-binding protein [Bacillota bacterium]
MKNKKKFLNNNKKMMIVISLMVILIGYFMIANIISLLDVSEKKESLSVENKVVLIRKDNDEFYWDNLEFLLKKHSKNNNFFIDILETDTTGLNFQKDLFEMATLVKPKAIILQGFNDSDMQKIAQNVNTPIIFVKNDGDNKSRTTYIGQNNYSVGQKTIDKLIEISKDSLNIIVLTDDKKDAYKNTTIEGILSKANENKNIILQEVKKINNRYVLEVELKEILKDNQSVNTIIATKPYYGIVAAETITRLAKVDEIKIAAFDQLPKTLDYIDQELIDLSIYNNQEMLAKQIIDVIEKINKDEFIGDVYYIKSDIITKENIDKLVGDSDEKE